MAPLVPAMFHNYHEWREAIGGDASVAEFWRTVFYLGLGRFGLELLVVIAIFFVLKLRPGLFNVQSMAGQRSKVDQRL